MGGEDDHAGGDGVGVDLADGFDGELGLALAADDDNRGCIAAGRELVEDVEAVYFRQLEVEHQDVDTATLHPGEVGLNDVRDLRILAPDVSGGWHMAKSRLYRLKIS